MSGERNVLNKFTSNFPGVIRAVNDFLIADGKATVDVECHEDRRGARRWTPGTTGVADTAEICLKDDNDDYGWTPFGQGSLDDRYVNVTGDDMSGDLTLANNTYLRSRRTTGEAHQVFAMDNNNDIVINRSAVAAFDNFISGIIAILGEGKSLFIRDSTNLVNVFTITESTGNVTVPTPGTSSTNVTTNGATQTLTNKTLTTPTIGSFTNAQHNHTNAAGGGVIATPAVSTATNSANVSAGTFGDVSVACASGTVRTGGGCAWNDTNPEHKYIVRNFPSGSLTWQCRGGNASASTRSLVAYAICMDGTT